MYHYIKKPFLFILILILPLSAQYFGQNKVQYNSFKWHYLQSEHFDVYFYPGAYQIAHFTANEAESSYVSLKDDFKYEITKRIKIILYKSHNDFQQTNVIDSYMPEGVGGVTELYKNRVVIPFEGSFSQLRHVLHHELVHAVMNDMLYGGSVQSIISGQVIPVPLWFSEGLAEYFSMRWDTRADMILRDATMNGYLPPIEYLSYYMAYQGGQSVFRFIAEKYGHEKVSELLQKIKGSFRFEGAFKSALGIKLEELSEEWQKEMRKEYWPDITSREETKDISRRITNHKEDKNYLNMSPAISPNGDKLVFLSDRDGTQSIYLMDIIENKIIKKLIKGETSINFEELHWLSPGMSWSPDGQKITLAAKAGNQDALYLYNLNSEAIEQYKFDLDGIFSATWSPTRPEIAFSGNLNGASDIYIYDYESKKLTNITNDVFSDSYPKWSSDGDNLVFVSDRGDYIDGSSAAENFSMSEHDYNNTDIYILSRDGSEIKRVTDDPSRESEPIFSDDDKKLLYVSDNSGVYNIVKHDLETDSSYTITNLLTGAFQLSLDKDSKTLAFASFTEGGWDIYTIKNPFDLEPREVKNTIFMEKQTGKEEEPDSVKVAAKKEPNKSSVRPPSDKDYRNYIFANMGGKKDKKQLKVELKKETYKTDDGHYKVRNYKVKFSPDIVNAAAAYNTLWGFQGYTSIAFSDVLGNHKIYLGSNLVFDLRNSYFTLQYFYVKNRINYGATFFQYANTYYTYYGLVRYRNYGLYGLASLPFNKFTRIDFSLNWWNVMREYLQIDAPSNKITSILPGLQLVHDTSQWTGYDFAPRDGFRGSLAVTASPAYTNNSPEFFTVKTDLRKYVKLGRNYSLGFRLNTGASRGKNPQRFFIGGTDNWLNRSFNRKALNDSLYDVYDVYFSEFVTPLRGARYFEMAGNNFALINMEFRFPLIPYMQLGFPPIALGNIKGAFFTDIGTAWDSENQNQFRGVKNARLHDIVAGYGVGARVYLGFLGMILKYDAAWKYDLIQSSKPKHYLSIGLDF